MSIAPEVCSIPHAYRDLLEGRTCAVLSTVMPDGQPQSTVVWCDVDGDCVLINTMRGFRKEKNLRANPRVTLLAYEQRNPLRSLEVRGFDMRGTRYIGLAKTHLQMIATAVAINLHRLFDWWEEKPRARTRISPFAKLAPDSVRQALSWVAG